MWFLVVALLSGTGDFDSVVLQMPSQAECRLQQVAIRQGLDPKGEKYNTSCEFVE